MCSAGMMPRRPTCSASTILRCSRKREWRRELSCSRGELQAHAEVHRSDERGRSKRASAVSARIAGPRDRLRDEDAGRRGAATRKEGMMAHPNKKEATDGASAKLHRLTRNYGAASKDNVPGESNRLKMNGPEGDVGFGADVSNPRVRNDRIARRPMKSNPPK